MFDKHDIISRNPLIPQALFSIIIPGIIIRIKISFSN